MTRDGEPPEDWYRAAFAGLYEENYRHRTDDQAESEIEWVSGQWELPRGSRLLDLGCGNGRHAAAWGRRGLRVVGLDASRFLLTRANLRGISEARFLCADMRRVPLAPVFDAVTSLFTSFGYFRRDEENERVLREAARVLRPAGRTVVDFLNAPRVRAELVPRNEKDVDGGHILEERWIDEESARVEKRITFRGTDGAERVTWESVRLFERDDLEGMMSRAGLPVDAVAGCLAGSAWTEDSPRLVCLGRKK